MGNFMNLVVSACANTSFSRCDAGRTSQGEKADVDIDCQGAPEQHPPNDIDASKAEVPREKHE